MAKKLGSQQATPVPAETCPYEKNVAQFVSPDEVAPSIAEIISPNFKPKPSCNPNSPTPLTISRFTRPFTIRQNENPAQRSAQNAGQLQG